jgi:1-acyl-sn-glycerol-3-phosphate acyltransferase
MLKRWMAAFVAVGIRAATWLLTGVRADCRLGYPSTTPCVYFANHTSHGDFALLWTVLPPAIRARVRPVAAADYWLRGSIRKFLIEEVFHAVVVDRTRSASATDPIELMTGTLDRGLSLVLFPEGTRNDTGKPLLPFKSGLYRLLRARPQVPCVPIWIDNSKRVLPKKAWLPVPHLCTVTFGAAIRIRVAEDQPAFLERARRALLAFAPAAIAGDASEASESRASGDTAVTCLPALVPRRPDKVRASARSSSRS